MTNPVKQVNVDDVINNPNVTKVYANSFTLGASFSDVTLICQLGNTPNLAISMSYSSAKSLSNSLQQLISHLEKVIEQPILDAETSASLWTKNNPKALLPNQS